MSRLGPARFDASRRDGQGGEDHHTYTSHLIVGLELDAATTSKLAGHANPNVTMRVYADDFRKATERNAAVLARAAERGFGT